MSFFKKKPALLRGKICDSASGIYIELPAKWEAIDMGEHTFLVFTGNKRGTGLSFSVSHLAMPGSMLLDDAFPGVIKEKLEKEGKFDCYSADLGDDKFLKIWQT